MSQAFFLENGLGKMRSARPLTRLAISAVNADPSMTRQEFSEECDVNNILARYEKAGGMWPLQPNGVDPVYYDFTEVPTDLMSSMNTMIAAEEAFMTLPALVRKEFDNDPMRFVDFASKDDNLVKMREWGLAAPEKLPDAPMRVEVVSPSIVPAAAPAASPGA